MDECFFWYWPTRVVPDKWLCVLWHCWLGVRKSIQSLKIEWWGVGCGYLSGARSRLFAYSPADSTATPQPPSSLALFKPRLVLPFWYRLTQVVLEKRQLNRCSNSSNYYHKAAGRKIIIIIIWPQYSVPRNWKKLCYAHTHTRLTALCPGLPGWAGTRKVNQSWFYWSKRQWVAVASAGPYANLHIAPDK